MSARDELASIAKASGLLTPGESYTVADAILAAGYTKPSTITTAEELDALPSGSVILDRNGLSLHRNRFSGWCASNGARDIEEESLHHEALPATVLYEPAP